MQHPVALNVIRSLGPQLEKGAAEVVLVSYATEHDLAPAQLEKLAQCYNMVRQLSHIDAAEDRGSNCHQIDTPSLLRTYAGSEKAAAQAPAPTFRSATHDASVDLLTPLRQEIRPMAKAASETPAADDPGANEITHPSIPAADPEAAVTFTPEQLKEAAWDNKVDLYMTADDILKTATCDGRHLQLAVAEHDAMRQVNPECVKAALNWLEKYAAQQRLSRVLARHEGPVKPAAFLLTSPLADKVVELAQTFTVGALLRKAAGSVRLGDIMTDDDDPTGLAAMLEAHTQDVSPDAAMEPAGGGNPAAGLSRSIPEEREEKSEKGGGGEAKTAPAKGGESKSGWLASLIGATTKPVQAAGNTAAAAGSMAQDAVRAVTSRETVNKDQIKADSSVADIKRSIMIRRLAANDPVLKEMPLADVLETYNAIVEQNPELASNPRRVLLAMREASSYEGITLDAQKQLGDVRGVASKTDAQESENTKRRYAV